MSRRHLPSGRLEVTAAAALGDAAAFTLHGAAVTQEVDGAGKELGILLPCELCADAAGEDHKRHVPFKMGMTMVSNQEQDAQGWPMTLQGLSGHRAGVCTGPALSASNGSARHCSVHTGCAMPQ